MKKKLILIIAFYLLTLLQTSFFVHFDINGVTPNLVLMAVVLLNFFLHISPSHPQNKKAFKNLGYWGAFCGGFFLDIFSNLFFGVFIIILLLVSVFVKKIATMLKEANIIAFLLVLLVSIIFYIISLILFNCLLAVFSLKGYCCAPQCGYVIIEIIYNLILALPLFYSVKYYEIFLFRSFKRF